MPLLDHFHPPVSERRSWEGFHGLWAAALVETLNRDVLPDEYFADMQVHVGSPVDVWVDAYPSRIFRGTVESIGAAAISEFALFPPTGNFTKVEQRIPVRIIVASADGLLKPGMMVIVGIEIPRGGKEGRETTTKASSSVN